MKFARSVHRWLSPAIAPSTAILALVAGVVGTSGCQALSIHCDPAAVIVLAPEPVTVPPGEGMRAAEIRAQQLNGARAYHAVGRSMEPLYPSDTALVVAPCDYDALHAGMPVVYVNHCGRAVAHVLLGHRKSGWVAQGLNNVHEDVDLVTSGNLVGVILQAFVSTDAALRHDAPVGVAVAHPHSLVAFAPVEAGATERESESAEGPR
jgi:hypothetical protein